MDEIFGLDLGPASIGYSLRNTQNGMNIIDQLVLYGSICFDAGVTGEYSCAAERTKHRSPRHLYRVRKYRIWETLSTLIEFGFCPLTLEELDKWRTYDKAKGLKRQYPVDAVKFEEWVRMNPYKLREELATVQLDFTLEENRFKLGRALYHIAQRRGFKSSKGETLKEQEKAAEGNNVTDEINIDFASLKKSEEIKTKDLVAYMNEHSLPTVGCAFAKLIREGKRIRASEYQAVRSQYREEIKYIFDFQQSLDIVKDGKTKDFFHRIYSDKKDGCIFYKNPLRSQKGLVGKCTLEPTKRRCPISHPEFEKFRAFAFINNIQYRRNADDEWQNLTAEQKTRLYREKFLQSKDSFKFEVIRKWIEKEMGLLKDFHLSKEYKTINYDDRTNVSACPVSGRLKSIFGENWEEYRYQTVKTRKNKKNEEHIVSYTIEDIWHICFSYDDEDAVVEFARSLGLDATQEKKFLNLWMAIPQGYAMLSQKAIRNINRFLVPQEDNPLYKGYIYTEACFLGKVPDVLGAERWIECENEILSSIDEWMNKIRWERRILNIVNNLISAYKALDNRFGHHDTEYQLDDLDKKSVENSIIESFGKVTWEKKPQETKDKILKEVEELYQRFFSTLKRDYYQLPKLGDAIKQYLSSKFPELYCADRVANSKSQCDCTTCKKLNQLYHPSMVEFYRPFMEDGLKLLGSPIIDAFKNPLAMRVLHQLRHLVNHFIKERLIDEDTRIVVEMARDLNDANMRWAINEYNREREKENEAIVKAIKEIRGEVISENDRDKARLLIEQNPNYLFDYEEDNKGKAANKRKKEKKEKIYKKDVTKYHLWLEQEMQCLYTGKTINLSDLFDGNRTEIEHTIPRSRSFDDSMANKTVCYAHYNRHTKKNRMPTELPDYEKIESHLLPWKKRVEQLKDRVGFWRKKSKQAQTKDKKDDAIRQKHLWQMELDYWNDKLSRFTMTEIPDGFKHRQLNDTRLITKYAYHYLKSVFNKVDVQKGIVTAEFRKILKVQSVDEKKCRDKHSHHAIDATILTMIPVAAKRDEMLKLFYEKKEGKKLGVDTSYQERLLQEKIDSCKIGDISSLTEEIESKILIKHISKDQALTPAMQKKRIRGKVIWLRDEKGEICKDANGKGIPKYRMTGDCIRGELHKDSFYGAIKQSKKKNGDSYQTSYQDISYVIRKELRYKTNPQDTGFKDLEDLHKVIVDEHLFDIIKQQCEGKSFKDACNEGFYMLNSEGEKVNRIRHIRCYTDVKNPLHIKKQTYLSTEEYKQSYHVRVGDLYVMGRYCNADKTKRSYKAVKLFDVCKNRKKGYDIPETDNKGKEIYYLDAVLHRGKQMILYKDIADLANVLRMSEKKLSERLYVFKKFESDNRVILKRHICSKPEKELGRGESIKSYSSLPEMIKQSINSLNYLLEDVDFKITFDGKIEFKDHLFENR